MTTPLIDWLTQRGGVAHTSTAAAGGFGPRVIAAAVAAQQVERIRRSWIVTPDCPSSRKRAASVGGRATCVSAARTIGLWTPTHEDDHVWVPGSASRLDRAGMHLHRATAPVPMTRTDPLEPTINVLFHVARCLSPVDALAVWESALRTRKVDADTLAAVAWRSARASRFARVATFLSDSGLETHFRELMRGIGISPRQQVWIDGHPDAVIGERLAVQIDGFAHHSSPADRRRDLRQDARLVLRGYTVLRFDYLQILFEPEYVIDTVRLAMAQGRHLATTR
ncbi:endonuclease domain-containing protein [Microbacterium sp. NPDC090007]|uniref:endonuclease domain-containing protein n=1 Tax=Microbacterium sp. NPDC090007 TaxID=3364204 RepID=UPI0037F701BC